MKKVYLFFALLCSLSAFSTVYLVNSPTVTWRTAAAGEVNVPTGTAFNTWYFQTVFVPGDQVWMAGGVYPVLGTTTLKDGVSIYGSFAGTETAISDRAKVNSLPWNFVNKTTIDGGSPVIDSTATSVGYVGLNTPLTLTQFTYIDGLEISNFARKLTSGAGAGVVLNPYAVMQNCIVTKNTVYTTIMSGGVGGAGVYVVSANAKLLNSYIHHNKNTRVVMTPTVTGLMHGGGVYMVGEGLIQGCNIEYNTTISHGAGIFVGAVGTDNKKLGGGTIQDCNIRNNTGYGNGGGIAINVTSVNTSTIVNTIVKNCNLSDNSANSNGGGLYLFNKSASTTLEGLKFTNNSCLNGVGGLYILNFADSTLSVLNPIKNCTFSENLNKNAAIEGAAFNIAQPTSIVNCVVVNNSGASAGIMSIASSKVYHSTFANNKGIALKFGGFASCEAKNNILWNNTDNTITGGTTPVLDYNAYRKTGMDAGTKSIATLDSINTFTLPTTFIGAPVDSISKVQAAAAKWSLIVGSPAIDGGTDLTLSGVINDFIGGSRMVGAAADMGAYEFGATAPNALKNEVVENTVLKVLNHALIVESKELTSVMIYNMSGLRVSSEQPAMNHTISLLPGVYIVQLRNDLGTSISKVLIK